MWSPVTPDPPPGDGFDPLRTVPSSRSKHASVLHGQYLYLLGGRNGNVPLKDFWRYNIGENKWDQLKAKGDPPGCLQEHSIIGHRDTLFVFGGEVGFSNGIETPLWMYDIKENLWRKYAAPKGVVTPKGRRSHTATVFQDSMYIYGGYQDLKGSSSELWAFHFASETWHLVSQGGAVDGPPGRHRHSAVLHDNAMWVYGGMTDLQERSDFWRFDFISRRWRPVKSKPGPGCLNSHCAVKFLSVMMLFGGERDGQTLNEMWRFHFATEFWEKLSLICSAAPQPRSQTTAFIFSQFTSQNGAVHFMGLPEQEYLGSQPEPKKVIKASEAINKFSFRPSDSCLDEDDDEGDEENASFIDKGRDNKRASAVSQIPQQILQSIHHNQPLHGGGLPRSGQFQRLNQHSQPSNTLLAKFSRLAQQQYHNYSQFSNTASTESLNTASSTAASPCSVRLARSRSSSQFLLNTNLAKKTEPENLIEMKEKSVQNFRSLQKANSLEENNEDEAETTKILEKATKVLKKNASLEEALSPTAHLPLSPKSKLALLTKAEDERISLKPSLSNSASVNHGFSAGGELRLIDLEEEDRAKAFYSSDEFSSSGYESTIADVSVTEDRNKLSFSNPNYNDPAAEERRKNRQLYQLSRDESHQSFAQALSSPADSLFSDFQDFHNRLNQDLVEMSSVPCGKRNNGPPQQRPKSVYVEKETNLSGGHHHLPTNSSSTTNPNTTTNSNPPPPRPLSAEIHSQINRVSPLPQQSQDRDNQKRHLRLLMYVIGGREVGQVTVFRRPISVWRLDLTKTF